VVVEPFAGREHPGTGTGMAGRIGVLVLVYRGSVAPSPSLPFPLVYSSCPWREERTEVSLLVEKGRARMDSIDLARDCAFGWTRKADRAPTGIPGSGSGSPGNDEIAGAPPAERKEPRIIISFSV